MTDTEPNSGDAYAKRVGQDAVRGSLWTLIATLVSMPLGLATNIFLARCLGATGLGRFATYAAIFAVVATVADLGWTEATVQWLAAATARGEATARVELIRRCTGFQLCVSAPMMAACAAILLWPANHGAAVIAAGVIFISEALSTSTAVNTASARNALSAQIAVVATTATSAGLITAAAVSRESSWTWAAQCALTVVGPGIAMLRLDPGERRAMLRPLLRLRADSGWWTYATSACLGALVGTIVFGRSEVIVLRWNGMLAGAGVFTVITGLAGQMTRPLDSLTGPLVPMAAGLVAVDKDRAVRVFHRSLRITGMFGVLGACVFLPVGVVAIRPLYGHEYAHAGMEFAVLGLVSCTQTVLGPLDAFAFATRSAGRVLRINVVALIVDAGLAIGLVPLVGLWGAVAANAACQLVSLTWLTRLVAQRLKIRASSTAPAYGLFSLAVLLGLGEAAIANLFTGAGVLLVIPVILSALVLLRLALALRPEWALHSDDVAQLRKATNSRPVLAVLSLAERIGLVAEGGQP